MALLAVRISVTFHPSLDVVGGARNSGFLDVQIEARRLSVPGESEDEHRFELNITHSSHHSDSLVSIVDSHTTL